MRTFFMGAALLMAAQSASAQGILSTAKSKAQNAAAATNAHIAAEQKPEAQSRGAGNLKPPVAGQKSTARLEIARAEPAPPPSSIMRESYEYSREGRRDPFVSLLTTNELRPAMSDLRLTGILFDHSGRNSVATLRDLTTNAQYRVTAGSALGRMRVSAIRVKTVVFTIDEFGTTRKDSLVLGDSTKVRAK